MTFRFKKLGPGLLFAAASIGVSHLVQSTRAGADFGLGLIWVLGLVHFMKFPFFHFGPRYAMATGESLIHGYYRLHKLILGAYFILNLASIFTIQAAVTIVTAGLAESIFGPIKVVGLPIQSTAIYAIITLICCLVILLFGKYHTLDKIIKWVVIILTISTITAVLMAFTDFNFKVSLKQVVPKNNTEILFLLAFMGWMPAPLDISVWQSMWTLEKQKQTANYSAKLVFFDFNLGYFSTILIGLAFMMLGYLVMYHSPINFSPKAAEFSGQLISLYTNSLGPNARAVIGIAALTTMFSTTITTLDASPRVMHKSTELLLKTKFKNGYYYWLGALSIGTVIITFFFGSNMITLVKVATVLSFIAAPFFAIANYKLLTSRLTPKAWQPQLGLKIWSWVGISFLVAFSLWYILSLS